MYFENNYPLVRHRRNRKDNFIRNLVQEHYINVKDLVYPVFIIEGTNLEEPILSMPGQFRYTLDRLCYVAEKCLNLGVPALAIFPNIELKYRDKLGLECYNPDGLVQRAIRLLKKDFPELGVFSDIALDPYTESGHDGVLYKDFYLNNVTSNLPVIDNTVTTTIDAEIALRGQTLVDTISDVVLMSKPVETITQFCEPKIQAINSEVGSYVLNDETVAILVKQALSHAEAGVDFVCPSDMMDGRVFAIRQALDQAGFINTGIMAYSAKYASKFYGPFRDALSSGCNLGKQAKMTYQMNPANVNEAMHEVELDIKEGADIVMVKPGLPYLDVIYRVKTEFKKPTAAYHVSGEYAMLKAASQNGWLDYDKALLETMLCFKRAGSDIIWSYAALDVANLIKNCN